MSLFSGIILGIVLALPPGGILLVGLNLAMSQGFRRAMPYAYGTALVDTLYALLAVLGARTMMDFYANSVREIPAVLIAVQSLLVVGLLGYGVWLWRRRTPLIQRAKDGSLSSGRTVERHSARGPFFLGLGLNASNIFSPTFLAALAILGSQAEAVGVLSGNITDCVLYAVGFGIGNTLYMQLGMRLVAKYTGSLQGSHVLRIQKCAGVAFAAIGGMLFFNVLRTWVF
jgi:threonine/homoserine/homoserine lactone efflux protein